MLKYLLKCDFGSAGRRVRRNYASLRYASMPMASEKDLGPKKLHALKLDIEAALRAERFVTAQKHNANGYSCHFVPDKIYSKAKL